MPSRPSSQSQYFVSGQSVLKCCTDVKGIPTSYPVLHTKLSFLYSLIFSFLVILPKNGSITIWEVKDELAVFYATCVIRLRCQREFVYGDFCTGTSQDKQCEGSGFSTKAGDDRSEQDRLRALPDQHQTLSRNFHAGKVTANCDINNNVTGAQLLSSCTSREEKLYYTNEYWSG